ncbi:MAG: NHL repeat-containing protein [Kiloniellales bacterium]|nr:NHL repeat-containing protein [Kiloniellales bacterium]
MRWPVLAAAFCLWTLPWNAAAFEAAFLSASTVELDNPHDVKLSPDGKRLFVSDVGNDRVVVLDAESLELLGHFGADHQDGTHDVDFDAEGRLYVADTHNHRVTVYELEGTEGKLVGEIAGGLRKPEGVLVGRDGRVYVTGAGTGNLVVYRDGAVEKETSGLSAPHDLEFAPDGDLWIADAANDRMVRMSPDLETKTVLEGAPYDFSGPRYLDVAPDGTLVVADKYSHSVKVIAEDGRLLGVIGDGRATTGPGAGGALVGAARQGDSARNEEGTLVGLFGDGASGKGVNWFRTPEGVELSGDTAWIADSGNDRIVKYRITWK